MHAATHTLKPLDALYPSSLRIITGDSYWTHHCTLYQKVAWPSLATRREQKSLVFIYKAMLNKLPFYLSSLLKVRNSDHHTHSQQHITLDKPYIHTEVGKTAFRYHARHSWNKLQDSIRLLPHPVTNKT